MNSRKSGFTLVETLIYIAIMGVVGVVMVKFFLSISSAGSKTRVIREVQSNGRLAIDLISQKIRGSSGLNIASSTFGTDPGVLSLQYDSSADNPTLIQLTADDGQLVITEGTSTAIPITSDEVKITNLIFKNLSRNANRTNIEIDLTIEYDATNDVAFQYIQNWNTSVSSRL